MSTSFKVCLNLWRNTAIFVQIWKQGRKTDQKQAWCSELSFKYNTMQSLQALFMVKSKLDIKTKFGSSHPWEFNLPTCKWKQEHTPLIHFHAILLSWVVVTSQLKWAWILVVLLLCWPILDIIVNPSCSEVMCQVPPNILKLVQIDPKTRLRYPTITLCTGSFCRRDAFEKEQCFALKLKERAKTREGYW